MHVSPCVSRSTYRRDDARYALVRDDNGARALVQVRSAGLRLALLTRLHNHGLDLGVRCELPQHVQGVHRLVQASAHAAKNNEWVRGRSVLGFFVLHGLNRLLQVGCILRRLVHDRHALGERDHLPVVRRNRGRPRAASPDRRRSGWAAACPTTPTTPPSRPSPAVGSRHHQRTRGSLRAARAEEMRASGPEESAYLAGPTQKEPSSFPWPPEPGSRRGPTPVGAPPARPPWSTNGTSTRSVRR